MPRALTSPVLIGLARPRPSVVTLRTASWTTFPTLHRAAICPRRTSRRPHALDLRIASGYLSHILRLTSGGLGNRMSSWTMTATAIAAAVPSVGALCAILATWNSTSPYLGARTPLARSRLKSSTPTCWMRWSGSSSCWVSRRLLLPHLVAAARDLQLGEQVSAIDRLGHRSRPVEPPVARTEKP